MLGPNADAIITFRDEVAAFKNTLGVVLVGDDGTLGQAHIVFPLVEDANADPQHPLARPGGGPLHPGDEIRLSDLFAPGQLHEGQHFAFFTIQDGYRLNGDLDHAALLFQSDGHAAHLTDPTPDLFVVGADGGLHPVAGNDLPHRHAVFRYAAQRQPERRRSRPGDLGARARRRRPHDLASRTRS